jgi:hypothetical protein
MTFEITRLTFDGGGGGGGGGGGDPPHLGGVSGAFLSVSTSTSYEAL